MKRCLLILAIVFFAANAFAASSIVAATGTRGGIYFESPDGNMVVLSLTCTSHTDGSFTAGTSLSSSVVTGLTKFGAYYYQSGFRLVNAYATNGAASNPDTAGTVTIYDATGNQLVGSTAGDTLTLSTSASATTMLVVDRASSQRTVVSPLLITIGDTQSGSATSIFTLYLVLTR